MPGGVAGAQPMMAAPYADFWQCIWQCDGDRECPIARQEVVRLPDVFPGVGCLWQHFSCTVKSFTASSREWADT